MNLYNNRSKIINLFENKVISPSMYAYDGKSDGIEESGQKFDKSIGERVKLRKQKADSKTDETGDEQPETTGMSDLESEVSAEQRRETEGQGVKILTPQQMLSRLTISLAQLKAGNNSEKLKNEIRQLLYSLYRSKKLSKIIYKHLMNAI